LRVESVVVGDEDGNDEVVGWARLDGDDM